jgi:hypothetical protein
MEDVYYIGLHCLSIFNLLNHNLIIVLLLVFSPAENGHRIFTTDNIFWWMSISKRNIFILFSSSYVFINICKQIICFVKDIGFAKIIRNFILIYRYVSDFIWLNSLSLKLRTTKQLWVYFVRHVSSVPRWHLQVEKKGH